MKRMVSLFLAAAAMLMLFGACKTTESSSGESTAVSAENSVASTGKQPSAVKTDVNGLYSLGKDWTEQSDMISVSAAGSNLLLEYILPGLDRSSETVALYSPENDKITGTLELGEGTWELFPLSDGGFYVLDTDTGTVTRYDAACQTALSYELKRTLVHPAVSEDGKFLLFEDQMNGQLLLCTLSTGELQTVYDSNSFAVWIGWNGGKFYCANERDRVMSVDPYDGSTDTVSTGNYAVLRTGTYLVEEDTKRFIFSPLDEIDARIETAVSTNEEYPWEAAYGKFVTYELKEQTCLFRIYDLKEGKLGSFSLPGTFGSVCVLPDGTVYAVTKGDAGFLYYLIDLSEAETQEIEVSDSTVSYDRYDGLEMPEITGGEEIKSLASELLEDYGIRAVYSEENLAEYMNFPGFSGNPVSEEQAYAALKTIKESLSFYPDGILDDVTDGRTLWVFLAKELLSDGQSASGATVNGISMVVDATYEGESLAQIFAHEFMHVMERNMVDHRYLNNWDKLMPESIRDSCYTNSYELAAGYENTPFDSGTSEIWFVDSYAKTFSAEDRARIFENLYRSYEEGKLTTAIDYENILTKARYLCVMIRTSFESCQNAQTLPWETYLGEIDLHEFDALL